MEYYYRTASCIEDVDVQEELESFETVMYVYDHHSLSMGYDEEYQDVDYIISVTALSEVEDIKEAIDNLGWPSVYFEWVDEEDESDLEEYPVTMLRYPEK